MTQEQIDRIKLKNLLDLAYDATKTMTVDNVKQALHELAFEQNPFGVTLNGHYFD